MPDTKMKLSILIATMPSRKECFARLLNRLDSQLPINGSVEILWDDSMEYNIGTKRNKLLERSSGEYVVFIDCDDLVSKDYVRKILLAAKSNPDAIGISGWMTTNGKNKRSWHISKDYGSWYTKGRVYYRTNNHISPIKRTIALQAGFPEISRGEDAVYSERVKTLIKTEVKIKGDLYYYLYNSKK